MLLIFKHLHLRPWLFKTLIRKKKKKILQKLLQVQKKSLTLHRNLPEGRLFFANQCENSSVGRARPCQGRGRGFESRFSLQKRKLKYTGLITKPTICQSAKIAQLVEHDLAKVGVAGSSPVFRSKSYQSICPDGGIGRRATLRG